MHGDIVIDALCEDIGVLKYKGYSVHQCPGGIVPDVRSAYGDASALHIPKPGQQLPRRGLAPAGGTHQRNKAARWNLHAHMVQRHAAQGVRRFLIGKAHIPERQCRAGRHCVYLPLACRLHLQHIINLVHPHGQVPKFCAELHQLHQRADHCRPHNQEQEKIHHQLVIPWVQVQQHTAGNQNESQHRQGDGLIGPVDWGDPLEVGHQVASVLFNQPGKPSGRRFRPAKDFFLLHAGHIFGKGRVQLCGGLVQLRPDFLPTLSAESRKLDDKSGCQCGKNGKRQWHIDGKQQHSQRNQQQRSTHKVGYVVGNNALHLLDVVAHGLLYSAGLPAGKKAQVQFSHMAQDAHAQVIERPEGTGVADHTARNGQQNARRNACQRHSHPKPRLGGIYRCLMERRLQENTHNAIDRVKGNCCA